MKRFRFLLAILLLFCAAALAHVTSLGRSVALEEPARMTAIASRYCAPQWHALPDAGKAQWRLTSGENKLGSASNLLPVENDAPDTESFEAWNKHAASTLALREFILSFFTLYESLSVDDTGKTEQLEGAFASWRAKYRLWSCLSLNTDERRILAAKFQSIDEAIDAGEIYQLEEKYECMGLERITEAALDLNPAERSFPEHFREVVQKHLRVC